MFQNEPRGFEEEPGPDSSGQEVPEVFDSDSGQEVPEVFDSDSGQEVPEGFDPDPFDWIPDSGFVARNTCVRVVDNTCMRTYSLQL